MTLTSPSLTPPPTVTDVKSENYSQCNRYTIAHRELVFPRRTTARHKNYRSVAVGPFDPSGPLDTDPPPLGITGPPREMSGPAAPPVISFSRQQPTPATPAFGVSISRKTKDCSVTRRKSTRLTLDSHGPPGHRALPLCMR